jgi:hypothetical protein
MPKVDIDYSNTLFYKISCRDTNIADVYIGHTTNFVQRKSGHKQGCNNPKYANYNLKLYTVIREHGGWDNWRMDIIAYHECNDLYEARKKEQEYFILYNATLNSIEPMPRPKCVNIQPQFNENDVKSNHNCDICNFSCFNTQDAFNLHLTRNRHIKAVSRLNRLSANVGDKLQKVGTEHICESCNYITDNKKDYAKHLLTAKHIRLTDTNEKSPECCSYMCNSCGKSYKHAPSLCKHKKKCKGPQPEISETTLPKPEEMMALMFKLMCDKLPDKSDQSQLVIELLKQNQDFNEIMLEQSKQLAQQLQLLEAVKDGKLGNKSSSPTL